MRLGKGAGTVVAVAFGILSATQTAWCQSDFELWFNPEMNDEEGFLDCLSIEVSHYEKVSVDRPGSALGLTSYDLQLRWGGSISESSDGFLSVDFNGLDFHGYPRLRRTYEHLPSDVYDFCVGGTYRRFLSNGWSAGASLQAGATGDDLWGGPIDGVYGWPGDPNGDKWFYGGPDLVRYGSLGIGYVLDTVFDFFDEPYAQGTAFLRIPRREDTAWIFYLDAHSQRQYPVVPGFGYQFKMGDKAWAILGMPVVAAGGNITERTEFSLNYTLFFGGHAEIAYHPVNPLKTFVAFDWDQQHFTLDDRDGWDDRLVFDQKRVKVGVEYEMKTGKEDQVSVPLGLNVGYAFDRSISEGSDRHERHRTELDIGDAWFVGASVGLRW